MLLLLGALEELQQLGVSTKALCIKVGGFNCLLYLSVSITFCRLSISLCLLSISLFLSPLSVSSPSLYLSISLCLFLSPLSLYLSLSLSVCLYLFISIFLSLPLSLSLSALSSSALPYYKLLLLLFWGCMQFAARPPRDFLSLCKLPLCCCCCCCSCCSTNTFSLCLHLRRLLSLFICC